MSTTQPRDPYDVLGVARDADDAALKKAFRRLAREHHPDVNPGDADAEERFKEVSEAYEILSDPQTRATYDRLGHDGLKAGGFHAHSDAFGSLSDILGAFFGGSMFGGQAPGGPRQGDDLGVHVDLTLAEAYTGVQREVELELIESCEHCRGNGAEPGTPIETCDRCGGHGVLQAATRTPFGQVMRQVACDRCGGEGRIPQTPCAECSGRGRVVRERTLTIDVPAGVDDGQRLRVAGRGHAGEHGGPPGDLYALIGVAAFDGLLRDGADLVAVADVALPDAALGTTVTVDHPSGEPVAVEVPAGSQPGEMLRERGRGMPLVGRPGAFGDLRVVVGVVVPRRLTDEQRLLLERLSASIEPEQLQSHEPLTAKLRRLFHR